MLESGLGDLIILFEFIFDLLNKRLVLSCFLFLTEILENLCKFVNHIVLFNNNPRTFIPLFILGGLVLLKIQLLALTELSIGLVEYIPGVVFH